MLNKWIAILPKREGRAFTKIDRLCALHFGKECFLEEKDKQGNLNGRRRLTQLAIPTKFPKEIPSYCIGNVRERNPPAMNRSKKHQKAKQCSKEPEIKNKCTEATLEAPQQERGNGTDRIGKKRHRDNSQTEGADNQAKKPKLIPSYALNFETLLAFADTTLELPENWVIKGHKKDAVCICKLVFYPGIGLSAEKNIVVQKNGPTLIVINGRPAHTSLDFELSETEILTLESLSDTLIKIDSEYKICPGISKNEHAAKCSGLIPKESRKVRCNECKSALKYQNLMTSRQKKRKDSHIRPFVFTSLRMKLAALATSVKMSYIIFIFVNYKFLQY